MIKSIVCISFVPLTQKVYNDFYLKEFKELNICVEFWDVSILVFGKHKKSNNSADVLLIESKSEFYNKIKLYSNSVDVLFIANVNYSFRTIFLFRELKKHNLIVCSLGRGMVPTPSISASKKNIFFKYFSKVVASPLDIIKYGQSFYALCLKRLNLVAKTDLLFIAGNLGHLTLGIGAVLDLQHAETVKINSFDYDEYLNLRGIAAKPNTERFIVFLDEYLPHHPDFLLLKMETLPENIYYSNLNSFFDEIERNYDAKVVIAAHPKSNYLKYNPFNERQIINNNTAQLVRDSILVLAHMSTAISFGVFFRKPILLLASDLIKNLNSGYIYNYIKSFSDELGLDIIEIDRVEKSVAFSMINSDKYDHFKYNYCTSKESEERLSAEIIIDFLHTKFKLK